MSMSTIILPADQTPDRAPARRLWIAATAILLLGAAAFGFAFRVEIVRAVEVWEASTAYNHCFLILPISAYLIWERRASLLGRLPAPAFWPLLLMVPVGAFWLFAAQLGVMEGRQFAAMGLLQLFFLAVLGLSAWRVVAFALLYLFFLVPSGAFLTPTLQNFAAAFAVRGLDLLGIPVFFEPEGLQIDVPGASFTVAEACAGLRFLIASVALGTLYGYLMYRSTSRRILFVVVSIIVPIIANGLRVLGIVVLGYILGSAEAAAADHLIYGWVFFSAVSLLLILLGLPFRQPLAEFAGAPADKPPARYSQAAMLGVGVAFGAFVILLVSPPVAEGPIASAMSAATAGLKHALGR